MPDSWVYLRFAIAAAAWSEVFALVHVPSIISDGMVLQDYYMYDSRSFIYGWADAGEVVQLSTTTTITGQITAYATTADSNGSWIVQLNPDYFVIAQPQTMNMTIAGSSDNYTATIVIRDIAYGDVFVVRSCSAASWLPLLLVLWFWPRCYLFEALAVALP